MKPTVEQRVAFGREADALLDPESTLGMALAMSRESFIDRWIDSNDAAEKERCHAGIHALTEVKRNLLTISNDGVVAEEALEEQVEA